MEHQSAVAYGNKYENGYLGSDLSRTGIGMLFDFIIIHESGHEWFGNSITSKDIADMWIHEGFTCYSESVFLECQYGIEKAQQYINGLKYNIKNDEPIIAKYGVNKEGSGDMYYKGALMLNTIRHILNDDDKWWKIILEYSNNFKHKIIDTETVLAYFNEKIGMDLTSVFNQYLRHTSIPKLELKIDNYKLCYRWKASEPNFEMPVDIKIKGEKIRINATSKWVKSRIVVENTKEVEIQKNDFLVN
jgi:aminopeptidase N